jgi:hypothetical protein
MSSPLDRAPGECRVCREDDVPIRNLDLYVTGSEGLWCCEACERRICEFVRTLQAVASSATRAAALRRHREGR